jgi:4-hydroxy-2-oxoheptanedioate aldolase
VRTAIGMPAEVEKALDLGAGGVVVPMVNRVETARALAQVAKYPPLGGRSLGGDNFLHYGGDYPEKANEDTLLLVQMEHIEGVNNIEEILALPGVDGCFVGPVDLALSMGMDRHTYEQHPDHRAAMKRIVAATLAAGKLPCCNTYSPEDFAAKQEAGFRVITLRSDMDLLVGGGQDLLGKLQKIAVP